MSYQRKAKELRAQRATLVEEARALHKAAEDAGQELDGEQEARWNEIDDEVERLGKEIEAAERSLDREGWLSQHEAAIRSAGRRVGAVLEDPEEGLDPEAQKPGSDIEKRYAAAFDRWVRGGPMRLSADEHDLLESRHISLSPNVESRAQGVSTDTLGGFSVPEDSSLMTEIERAMKQFGGIESVARVITTSDGRDLPLMTSNDTGNEGELLSENTEAGEQDATLGQLVMHAYTISSKQVPVSRQLFQDSVVNWEEFLGQILGERIGRKSASLYTTGTGAAQPTGFLVGGTAGPTSAVATAVSFDDLYELKHAVDPSYRMSPSVRFVFNDSTLKRCKKLKDGQGRPLWVPGHDVREPSTIDGDQYLVLQQMPDVASGAKAVAYGDFSKFIIRRVAGVQMLRLDERRAEKLQVVFLAFARVDSGVLNAGTAPIKWLVQA